MQLARAVQDVCGVLCAARFVEGGFRPPVNHTEADAAVDKAVAQDVEEAGLPNFAAKAVDELALAVLPVDADKFLPAFGLGGLDEGEQRRLVEREGAVEGGGVAFCVAADRAEVFFYILLKALFLYVEVGHKESSADCFLSSSPKYFSCAS